MRFQPTRPLRGATHLRDQPAPPTQDFNPRAPCGARRFKAISEIPETEFQPTRPLRGATLLRHRPQLFRGFQPTRPLRGATRNYVAPRLTEIFQPTRPLRGATDGASSPMTRTTKFQPTRPLRGATLRGPHDGPGPVFQPTRPLRGATAAGDRDQAHDAISTHAPLAGRDQRTTPQRNECINNFNPRAPCGARRHSATPSPSTANFNPRAPCGARPGLSVDPGNPSEFQPTRPLRGATLGVTIYYLLGKEYFNPRAPCGARHHLPGAQAVHLYFNPRAPCGARRETFEAIAPVITISTHAPLAGRDPRELCGQVGHRIISTHAPLAGRDTDVIVKRYIRITDFNPRAPCGARQQKCTNHYAHFCDNRQISDAFAQNAACQGILLLFDAGKSCGFWVRTAQVISAHLCFAL